MKKLKYLLITGLATAVLTGCGSDSGTGFTTSGATDTATTNSTTGGDILARGTSDGGRVDDRDGTRDSDGREQGPVVTEARTYDGTDNNFANLGSAEVVFAEDTTRAYGDGIGSPSGENRPNPREISNAVVNQTEDTPDPGGRTAFLWLWGQFLDHDITLTHENGLNDFPISIPAGDPYFDPTGTGNVTLPFSRSVFEESSGTSLDNPRAQVNSITSFIDASMVYGSDEERASALRTFEDGLLATSGGELPPYNTEGLENAGGTSSALFLCGDVRANENLMLTSMHTVFIREHNRIATQMKDRFPEMTDEELYQAARKRVGAIVQAITFNEYIPALLGRDALREYRGYKPDVDPRVGILFATAAYRLGHSQAGSAVPRLDANGNEIAAGNLTLADAFFNPGLLPETGIEPILRGAAQEPSQKTDSKIIDELRNFLFGPPGAGGLDLASLNLQRGRDHGMPDFNTVRTDYGFPEATDFSQITSDIAQQEALASVYSGPDQIDPWVGLLSEDPVRGGVTGPTLRKILAQQFERLRDGDRFFYLNDPDLARERDQIHRTRLSEVIERNSDITGLQDNIFFNETQEGREKPRRRFRNRKIPRPFL